MIRRLRLPLLGLALSLPWAGPLAFAQTEIPAGIAGDLGTGQDRGFRVRSAQAPEFTEIPRSIDRARQQLNGTLVDLSGEQVADEAVQGPNPDGSFNVDLINFEQSGLPETSDLTNFPDDAEFPGIPGTKDHLTLFATEVVGYLELTAGQHTLGGQVFIDRIDAPGFGNDNGFSVFTGTNPRDFFATELGSFVRSEDAPPFAKSPWDYEFTITAPTAGIYPVRLVFYAQSDLGDGNGGLEFYDGDLDLINSDASSIKSYQTSTSPIHNHAYIAEVAPTPGTAGIDAALPVEVLLLDDQTTIDPTTVVLTYNGADITSQATVDKDGGRLTVTYQPPVGRQSENNNLTLSYTDSAGTEFSRDWSYQITVGDQPPKAVGQWDFDGGLQATVGKDLEYRDGDDGITAEGTEFGTTSSFGIPDIGGEVAQVMSVPEDPGNDIGYNLDHGISPNGGGSFVNQYTIVMDVLKVGGGGASAILQASPGKNPSDATFFWQGSNMGQGGGGYNGDGSFIADEWHRIGFAVDLSDEKVITKWVNGVLQDEWTPQQRDHIRRAMEPVIVLFSDGDERSPWFVNSVQVYDGKLSDEAMEALGGPTAEGFEAPNATPLQISTAAVSDDGAVTLTWDSRPGRSFTIEASNDLQAWEELTDGYPSQGEVTQFTEPGVAVEGGTRHRYYRIKEE